jgi:hypothetical protein
MMLLMTMLLISWYFIGSRSFSNICRYRQIHRSINNNAHKKKYTKKVIQIWYNRTINQALFLILDRSSCLYMFQFFFPLQFWAISHDFILSYHMLLLTLEKQLTLLLLIYLNSYAIHVQSKHEQLDELTHPY